MRQQRSLFIIINSGNLEGGRRYVILHIFFLLVEVHFVEMYFFCVGEIAEEKFKVHTSVA